MKRSKRARATTKPTATDYYVPFTIDFGDERSATALRVPRHADAERVIAAFGLSTGQPALFISGGAGLMEPRQMEDTREAVLHGLARFANDYRVTVVDGGTQAGVMALMGEAHREHAHGFTLIGVAPYGAVALPGTDAGERVPLEPNHTHFVLCDGEQFGDESDLIAALVLALSHGREPRPFGVVINGGGVTTQETYDRALQPETALPLLVFSGSGRFSDALAAAAHGAHSDDARISTILSKVEVHVVALELGPERVYAELERLLS